MKIEVRAGRNDFLLRDGLWGMLFVSPGALQVPIHLPLGPWCRCSRRAHCAYIGAGMLILQLAPLC